MGVICIAIVHDRYTECLLKGEVTHERQQICRKGEVKQLKDGENKNLCFINCLLILTGTLASWNL